MTGTARSNNPGGQPGPVDAEVRLRPNLGKVRELQRRLWAAAKQSSGRRFHALYDRIYRDDVLVEAWERVKANRGAAGVDRVTLAAVGRDVREVIADLNPVLRGWGNYFRSGNAATKFRQIDHYVVRKLRTLMVKKRGRNLRAGQVLVWDEDWFNGHGLHRLRGTIRYPKAA